MTKKEVAKKILEEGLKYQEKLHDMSNLIYGILGVCFRAQVAYEVNDGYKYDIEQLTEKLHEMFIDEELNVEQKLFTMQSVIISSIGDEYIKELKEFGELEDENGEKRKLSTLSFEDSMTHIDTIFINEEFKTLECITALKVLSWTKDLLEK